jgi:hypothetical protein
MSSSLPAKTRVKVCSHCEKPVERELIRLVREFDGRLTVELLFCGPECMDEYLYDERIGTKVNDAVRKELNEMHRLICPSCRRRLM